MTDFYPGRADSWDAEHKNVHWHYVGDKNFFTPDFHILYQMEVQDTRESLKKIHFDVLFIFSLLALVLLF